MAKEKKVKLTKKQKRALKREKRYIKAALKFYRKRRRINRILDKDIKILSNPVLNEVKVTTQSSPVVNRRRRTRPVAATNNTVKTSPEQLALLNKVRFFEFNAELLIHKKLLVRNEKLTKKYNDLYVKFSGVEKLAREIYTKNGALDLFKARMGETEEIAKDYIKDLDDIEKDKKEE